MASYDVDFDVAAATNWKLEVEMELDAVKRELDDVSDICREVPGENDTIMQGLQDIGNWLEESWGNLCNGFSQMCTYFGNIISGREQAINEISESLENYKSSNSSL